MSDHVLLCWYGIPHAATLPHTNELQSHLSPCKNNTVLTTTPPGLLAAYTTRWATFLLYTFTSTLCHHLIIYSLPCDPRFPPCSPFHLSTWLTSHARFTSALWPSVKLRVTLGGDSRDTLHFCAHWPQLQGHQQPWEQLLQSSAEKQGQREQSATNLRKQKTSHSKAALNKCGTDKDVHFAEIAVHLRQSKNLLSFHLMCLLRLLLAQRPREKNLRPKSQQTKYRPAKEHEQGQFSLLSSFQYFLSYFKDIILEKSSVFLHKSLYSTTPPQRT